MKFLDWRKPELEDLGDELALAVLRYYAHLARVTKGELKDMPYRPSYEDRMVLGCGFLITVCCEARYSVMETPVIGEEALILLGYMDSIGALAKSHTQRTYPSYAVLDDLADKAVANEPWPCITDLLESAMMLFSTGRWARKHDVSIGGLNWAYCARVAYDLLLALQTKGMASNLVWERLLNAVHNNSTWLDKINKGKPLLSILSIGAMSSPREIIKAWEHVEENGYWSLPPIPRTSRNYNNWTWLGRQIPKTRRLVENPYYNEEYRCRICKDSLCDSEHDMDYDQYFVLETKENRCPVCNASEDSNMCHHRCRVCGGYLLRIRHKAGWRIQTILTKACPWPKPGYKLCDCDMCLECHAPKTHCVCYLGTVQQGYGTFFHSRKKKYIPLVTLHDEGRTDYWWDTTHGYPNLGERNWRRLLKDGSLMDYMDQDANSF